MAEIVSAFLDPLCERLINTVLDEYALVTGVKEEIRKLKKTVQLIEAVLQDAENKQETERPVRIWHGTLKQILYDAEDVLDEVATNAALKARDAAADAVRPVSARRMRAQVRNIICCFGTIDNISADREIALQIKTIRESLDHISRETYTLGLQRLGGSSVQRQKRPETSSLLDDASHVIGRDDDKKTLMELLLGSGEEIRGGTSHGRKNVRFITIVGMGGVGKTTLARDAYNDPTVKKHFELMAWVCISNDFDVARITNEIIDAVSGDKEGSRGLINEVSNWDRAHRMLKTKLEGKRFLLVLDDMWEEDPNAWERLSPPFMYGAEGSRIVVTTRKKNISNIINGTPIKLKKLPSEDLWFVFARYAFGGFDPNKHRQLETIGREIVKNLQGSPLAAKTVGRLLYAKKDVMHWESVKNSKNWVRSQQDANGILAILKLSYDYLPGHLKQCFAYCSLFPEDYYFDKDELVQFWKAQNFIQVRRGVHAGEVLSDHFDSLLDASFFEQSVDYDGRFVMHDLIHELAESIYEDEYFRYDGDDDKNNKMNEKKRHLSVATRNFDPTVLNQLCEHGKNLRTLLFLRGCEVDLTSHLDSLFMKLKRLRVLVLHFCKIQLLPESIGNLKHLRYAGISLIKISKLPESICNLHNLEVLKLKFCAELSSLPESIGNLKHLRHVDISNTKISKLPESICNLHNLEVLKLVDCNKLSSLPESIGNLKHLRHVHISYAKITKLPESICNLHNLEVLKLDVCTELSSLPESIGNLKHLRHVDISCPSITELPESICNLHNLEVLGLELCSGLSSLPSNMCALVNLRRLKFSHPFEFNGLGKLTALENIIVRGGKVRELAEMRMLQDVTIESLQVVKSKEEAIQAKLGSKTHLRALILEWSDVDVEEEQGTEEEVLECLQPAKCIRELKIRNNRGAKPPTWLRDGLSSSSLERVELIGCINWQVLPALGQLPCLKYLKISAMHMGGGQFQHSHGDAYFPSLEELRLDDLPELVKWEVPWPPHEQHDDGDRDDRQAQHQLSVLPRLRELQITKCPLLRQLPPLPPLKKLAIERVGLTSLSASGWFPSSSSPALASLQNLVEMKIENCQDLSLPETAFAHFTSLTSLEVTDCPKLSWFTSAPMKDALPSSLRTIVIDACAETRDLLPTGPDERLSSVTSLHIEYDMPSTSSAPLKSPQPPLALKSLKILRSSPEQIKVWLLHCPSLEELTIERCPLLRSFHHGDACDDTGTDLELALLNMAPTLRRLEFQHCENLGSLPSKLERLSSLIFLHIYSCPILECLPSAGLPEWLQLLRIADCPKLSERCKEGGPDWPLVCRVPHLYV